MLARFFYGYGEEIHFKDRLKNGEIPIDDSDMERVESFLKQIGAEIGYYQIDGTDLTSIVRLSHTKVEWFDGEYQEFCPHCGGYTDYDTADGSIMCMWCGEDLLPCDMCHEFREYLKKQEPCDCMEVPHKCRYYTGKNRLPDFSTKWDKEH